MRRILVGAIAVALVVLMATGCGKTKVNTTPLVTSASATTPGTAAPAPTTPPSTAPAVAHVGSSIEVADSNSNKASVTLAQVVDPAQGADQFTTPANGKRFVGLKFVIAAISGTLSDDANSDATIIGSDNQTYTAGFSDIVGCTNFNSGTFTVAAGGSSTGCVTFEIPTNVKVANVRFDINGGFGNNIAEWQVP